MNFTQGPARRRLFAGLVPTSSRETLQAAPAISPLDASAGPDPRIEEAQQRVFGSWQSLRDNGSRQTADQRMEMSRFLLLDYADFLATRLPLVWTAIVTGTPPAGGAALYTRIVNLAVPLSAGASMPLRDALLKAMSEWDRISGESALPSTLTVDLSTSFDPADLVSPTNDAIGTMPSTGARGPDPEVPSSTPATPPT